MSNDLKVWVAEPLRSSASLVPNDVITFREGPGSWTTIPQWIRFFVDLGLAWPDDGRRRIALVSTPCDSSAAGLIALGAMLRRLGESNANDLEAHVRRIRELRPGHRGTLRCLRDKHHYVLDPTDRDGLIWLRRVNDGTRYQFLDYHASDWYFDGEAAVGVKSGDALPWRAHYAALLPANTSIDPSNLATTDSTIVLAGRSTGKTAQAEVLSDTWFRCDERDASLLDLLTIQAFQPPRTVSRMRYLSSRSSGERNFDRLGTAPRIVVADGGDAFRVVLSFEPCENASIVAHIPRTDDQSRLEDVAAAISGLRQWYEYDASCEDLLPVSPAGVFVRVIRRKT